MLTEAIARFRAILERRGEIALIRKELALKKKHYRTPEWADVAKVHGLKTRGRFEMSRAAKRYPEFYSQR